MNIGELMLSVGLNPSRDFKQFPKTLAKMEGQAFDLARSLNRLGSTSNVFAQLDNAAKGLSGSISSVARATYGQASAIKEVTKAQSQFNKTIAQANRIPKGGALDIAGAVGMGRTGLAGLGGQFKQGAAAAKSAQGKIFADALLHAKVGAMRARNGMPPVPTRGGTWSPGTGYGAAGRAALAGINGDGGGATGMWGRMVSAPSRVSWASFREAAAARGGGVNWSGTGDPFNPSGNGREYFSGGDDNPNFAMQPNAKRPGFFSRMFGGGGGGGAAGGAGRGGRRGGGGGLRNFLTGGGGRGGASRNGALGEASTVRRIIMGAGILQGAGTFGELADTYAQLQMRLNGVSSSTEEASARFDRLRTIAKNTNSSLETTTEGYVRIKNATSDMKLTDEQTFKLMENLNTMLATSGASTQEAASGMRQLTQAFAKGNLDGDEFKSIAENMPNILKVLQKSLGKTEGQLRAMSKAGELTRDKLVKALLGVKDLQKPVDTFGSSWQKFKDDMMVSIGLFAKQNNLVENFGIALRYVGEVLMQYVLPGIAKLITFLKEHETIAKAIAIVGLASVFGGIAAAIIRFPFKQLYMMVDLYQKLKVAMMGTAAAGGLDTMATLGKPGGAGAGAAKGVGKLGKIGKLAGFLGGLASGPIGWGAMAGFGLGQVFGTDGAWMDETFNASGLGQATQSVAGLSTNRVNIGDITVNIQASDMTDAQVKFGTEMDKLLRQTSFGR